MSYLTVYEVVKMSPTLNLYSSKMQHNEHATVILIQKQTSKTLTGAILLLIEYFYFWYFKYILLIIITYFYFSKVLNAGLLLVVEYFHSVVLARVWIKSAYIPSSDLICPLIRQYTQCWSQAWPARQTNTFLTLSLQHLNITHTIIPQNLFHTISGRCPVTADYV